MRRISLFDVFGAIAIASFLAVLATDFSEMSWRGEEIDATVDPTELASGFREGVEWQVIYLQDAKVGFSRVERRITDEGYRVLARTELQLTLMGTTQEISMELDGLLDENLRLRAFDARLDSDITSLVASGHVTDSTIEVTMTSAGTEDHLSIPIDEPPAFELNVLPVVMREDPQPGERFDIPYFDPTSMQHRTMQIEYVGTEKIPIMGAPTRAYHLRQYVGGQELDVWVNALGEVLQQELPMGMLAIRESEAEATYGFGRELPGRSQDLVTEVAIPATGIPSATFQRDVGRFRLSGLDFEAFELAGGRQRFEALDAGGGVLTVARGDVVPTTERAELASTSGFPEQLLDAQPLLQVNAPAVQAKARELAGETTTVRDGAEAILSWVYESLEKRSVVGVPSAVEVLQTKAGDCNEHATLSVALLRAAGIPAQIASGVAYLEGSFFYHAWVEYWDGRWVSADPTWGQLPADVGHLRFVAGGLDRQMEILRLIGNLEIGPAPTVPEPARDHVPTPAADGEEERR